jgi:type I restriction enzyme, S subunit
LGRDWNCNIINLKKGKKLTYPGKVAQVTHIPIKATLGAFISLIRVPKRLNPKFIYLLLSSSDVQGEIRRLASTTTNISNISISKLKTIKISFPSLPEQEQIVSGIDELFTQLEAGVASLQRVKVALKRYKASVLKAAVEGRLVKEKSRMRNGELPEGWQWMTLPNIGYLGRGKSKHRPRNAQFLYGGKYPFIQTGDIQNSEGVMASYTQTYNDAGLAQSKLWPKGTLCITIAANIADTAILGFDACFPDSIVGFIANENVEVKFIEYYFRTIKQNLEKFAPATAQKNININVLQNVPIPIPSLEEQRYIVAEIERRLSVTLQIEETVEYGLKRAVRLRQAILKCAFEGRLVA